jgi:poly(glycerol-phosphate) alpha-glucosyltransferase
MAAAPVRRLQALPLDVNVVHLSHSAGAADGGIAIAVAELLAAQRQAGLDPRWFTTDHFTGFRRDRRLRRELSTAAPDLLHIHGLWRGPTRIAPALAASGLPLLIAPHGMLDPWALANSRWKKRLVWQLWERRALQAARGIQALCPAEAEAIAALGLATPIAVIPNGVAIPDRSLPIPAPPWSGQVPRGDRVLLFLGRFHPKKGIGPLLEAWSQLAPAAGRAGWWLALVGYGDGGALAARVSSEGMERCLVLGPCFGNAKDACLAGASAFVLPSFSEGLPMAALEAMAWRLPALLSPACNLPEAFGAGAAWPVAADEAQLVVGLRRLFAAGDQELAQMGEAGERLVRNRYSWAQVAEQIEDLYRRIQAGSGG